MKESGVTLLELLVTMTIVVILASIAMPLSKVTTQRRQEIELRQQLRTIRAAIDTFKLEWNRDGDALLRPVCLKNKLTCKDVTSIYGYPKTLDALLGVKLTGEEATVRGRRCGGTFEECPSTRLPGRMTGYSVATKTVRSPPIGVVRMSMMWSPKVRP